MIERFLKQTHFESVEDYNKHLEFIVPENFNFAYDVMDVWAEEAPNKLAILWTNDQGRRTMGEVWLSAANVRLGPVMIPANFGNGFVSAMMSIMSSKVSTILESLTMPT